MCNKTYSCNNGLGNKWWRCQLLIVSDIDDLIVSSTWEASSWTAVRHQRAVVGWTSWRDDEATCVLSPLLALLYLLFFNVFVLHIRTGMDYVCGVRVRWCLWRQLRTRTPTPFDGVCWGVDWRRRRPPWPPGRNLPLVLQYNYNILAIQ